MRDMSFVLLLELHFSNRAGLLARRARGSRDVAEVRIYAHGGYLSYRFGGHSMLDGCSLGVCERVGVCEYVYNFLSVLLFMSLRVCVHTMHVRWKINRNAARSTETIMSCLVMSPLGKMRARLSFTSFI